MRFILIVLSLLLFSSNLYAKTPSTILRDLDSLELQVDQGLAENSLNIQSLGSVICVNEFSSINHVYSLHNCLENAHIDFLKLMQDFELRIIKKYDFLLSLVSRNSEIAIIILTKKVLFLRSLNLLKETYKLAIDGLLIEHRIRIFSKKK